MTRKEKREQARQKHLKRVLQMFDMFLSIHQVNGNIKQSLEQVGRIFYKRAEEQSPQELKQVEEAFTDLCKRIRDMIIDVNAKNEEQKNQITGTPTSS